MHHVKLALATVALLLCISFPAQTPVPLAHGNVPGEPHHHLKIENDYVRAYYVEVAPHDSTQLHQHDLDYLYVILGPADIINAVAGKPELHQVLKDGEVHFTRGGFAHVARNLSDAPFRNVTIEFLHPQGDVRNLCGEVAPGPQGKCENSQSMAPLSGSSLLRTDEVYLHLLHFSESKARFSITFRGWANPSLLVALGQGILGVEIGKKHAEKLHSGDVLWFPGKEPVTFENEGGGAPSFLVLSFEKAAANNTP